VSDQETKHHNDRRYQRELNLGIQAEIRDYSLGHGLLGIHLTRFIMLIQRSLEKNHG
jgi:hypothetical protein